MIGKKVQVFWPVDESWYTGTVYEYDPTSGEHLLRYEDGDAEWVRIGESEADEQQQHPDTPSLETPQTTPDRPPEANLPPSSGHQHPLPPPSQQHPTPPGPPPRPSGAGPPGGMTYYQHVPMYSSAAGGPPQPGNVPGVVYAMYPPPPHHSPDYPPGRENDPGHGGGADSPNKSRKSGPKAWTKEEDTTLLRIVQTMQMPMKWSVVALSLPGRTGKQCRERYVNHLNPRLKVSDWNPIEDATIFHLYSTTGSHWSSMSKVIPGRTDNGIKNRFHNLRRQVEREDENRQKKNAKATDYPDDVRLDLVREHPKDLQGRFDSLWESKVGVGVLASDTVQSSEQDCKNYFGPFVDARDGQICVRCGFVMPSVQTGRQVCEKSGWCLACTLLPPQLSGNLLRETLMLRREKDEKYRKVIESWDVPLKEQRQDS